MTTKTTTTPPTGPFLTRAAAALLLVAAPLLMAAPASAQVGAFGGAPAGLDARGSDALTRAPIFTEGADLPEAGAWSATLLAGMTTGSLEAPGVTVDYEVTQTAIGGFYGVSDRLLVGATLQPWSQLSLSGGGETISESGRGDASVQARYRVFRSDDAATAVALTGGLGLPVGADGFGTEGVVVSAGAAASRYLGSRSLHASAGMALPMDDADGDSVLRLTGAAVFGVGARTAVSGELQARFSGGEHLVDLAPGVRFQPAPGVFVDAAVLVNLASSLEQGYDAGLVVALRLGGG